MLELKFILEVLESGCLSLLFTNSVHDEFYSIIIYLISICEIISNIDLTKAYGNHIFRTWKRLKITNIKLHMNL